MVSIPHSLPLGDPIPPNTQHPVSSSLPTWKSVGAVATGESWLLSQLKAGYPRFHFNHEVQKMSENILGRLSLDVADGMACLVLRSEPSAVRCVESLKKASSADEGVSFVRFFQPGEPCLEASWAQIYAVIYPVQLFGAAFRYWIDSGDGISTRHAEFCLQRFDYLQAESSNQAFCLPPVKELPVHDEGIPVLQTSGATEKALIKQQIALLVQSEKLDQGPVLSNDVFLYPGGMSAINAVARTLVDLGIHSGVVAFGWLYTETIKVLEHHWPDLTFYGSATTKELDELEASLEAGKQISALWTDVPGNPKLVTPDMPRIHRLAKKYDFIVLCDETVGTFANTDLLPYVDVLMTSLTKMYSGYCDVMGGSIVVNQRSSHHSRLHDQLTLSYEDTFFPGDIAVLHRNSQDFLPRVRATNHNAKVVAERLAAHHAVEIVNYPSMITREHYEQIRRQSGGYGHLMSIVFRNPDTAARFYDIVDICKGTSFGTTFTLSIAYAQLGTPEEQDHLEKHGIPKHLVRISVGLEDVEVLLQTLFRAIEEAETFEPGKV